MNGSRSLELHLIADFLVLSENDFFVAIDKANFLSGDPHHDRDRNLISPTNGATDW